MIEFFIVVFAALFLSWQLGKLAPRRSKPVKPKALPEKALKQLEYADKLYRERKFMAAEKVYLHILNVDSHNVTAYTRLGMIYIHLKNKADAIESFQMAVRYRPSADTYHNLGLAYIENNNYIKATTVLEKALLLNPTAAVYRALAKAQSNMSNPSRAEWALERAVELEPSAQNLNLLAEVYKKAGEREKWNEIQVKLKKMPPKQSARLS